MDGISAQWAYTVFREQWRLNNQILKLEEDNEQLRAVVAAAGKCTSPAIGKCTTCEA
jgi:hypothetical protein